MVSTAALGAIGTTVNAAGAQTAPDRKADGRPPAVLVAMADRAWNLLAGKAVPGLDFAVLALYVLGFGAVSVWLYNATG